MMTVYGLLEQFCNKFDNDIKLVNHLELATRNKQLASKFVTTCAWVMYFKSFQYLGC